MKREEYDEITKIIWQTIHFLNRRPGLGKDELEEIANDTLLKLTPHLKKILNYEKPLLVNFIRKTTKSAFWDYLKSRSVDLTDYRIKKRIKKILGNLPDVQSRFKKPGTDTPWYKDTKEIDTEMTPSGKQARLENIIRGWKINASPRYKSYTSEESLRNLIKKIFDQIDFGISVNDIFSSMSSVVDIDTINRVSIAITSPDAEDEASFPAAVMGEDEIPSGDFRIDERFYYENYAQEFLKNRVTEDQARVYYLRFILNLSYKEIEERYNINIKTAESRLSIKEDKKGFQWRLVQFLKELELSPKESGNFFEVLNRKIRELYSNKER